MNHLVPKSPPPPVPANPAATVKNTVQPAVLKSKPLKQNVVGQVKPVNFKVSQKHTAKHAHAMKKTDSAHLRAKVHSTAGSKWFFGSKKQSSPEVVKYGPRDCVSVWKNKENH